MDYSRSRERREACERAVKFVLCAIMGLGLGTIIGHSETPTIAVSAILMLYIDRGYTGSICYSWRRTITQFLMGGISFLFIYGFRMVAPMPDWLIGMLSASLAIVVGLPLQNRFHFAPLTATLGNSILIMTAGILGNPAFYPQRVVFCLLGALIAHLVNFVIVPQINRYDAIRTQMRENTEVLFRVILGEADLDSIKAVKCAEPLLEKDIKLFQADRRWKKLRQEPWRYELISGLWNAEHWLVQTAEDLRCWENTKIFDHNKVLAEQFSSASALHKMLLEGTADSRSLSVPISDMSPIIAISDPEEIILAGSLLRYIETITALAQSNDFQ